MEPARLIGIAGKKGSGKSTTASILASHLVRRGAYVVRMSFAAPMKSMVHALLHAELGYSDDEASRLVFVDKEEVIPALGFSSRQLLQTLGTEWARETLAEDFWIRVASHVMTLPRHGDDRCVFIFDDVRFENERDWITSMKGECLLISRPSLDNVDNHGSERPPRCKWNINNCSDLEFLRGACDNFVTMIGHP